MNESTPGHHGHSHSLAATTLAALGIVFGDIGTSPLYSFRECFSLESGHGAPINPQNLAGAASLIVWALLLVVSVKYLFIILKLDNRGEGGILALSTLIRSTSKKLGNVDSRKILLFGLAGAALIYADGMLTPAISVLSAVEGLAVSSPAVAHWTVPASVVILIGLFSIQRFGTGQVGKLFGPVVLIWFLSLALLGGRQILMHPEVIRSLGPWEGLSFLVREWKHAFPLLAAVFLAVTGGEALYADLGHFGTTPIRIGWFVVVLPALVINYLGQAALLTSDPSAIRNPFFLLAPGFLQLPLTILATAAAIIASQALISGAFSLTTQAVQLGCMCRMRVLYTSEHSVGQVYVPAVNHILAAACILLVITFQTSAALAGAYGIAISLTMTITSVLFFAAARTVWGWSKLKAGILTGLFLILDGAFLGANVLKIFPSGWLPLLIAAAVMSAMLIWIWGRKMLYARIIRDALPIDVLQKDLKNGKIQRVTGTAIYMSGKGLQVPTALLHNLKHNKILHERVILLHVETLDQPRANENETLEFEDFGDGLQRVTMRFGFAETPDVPEAFKNRMPEEHRFPAGKATYFLGRETYFVGKNATLFGRLRLSLFAMMARNASPATAYFQLPPGRVVELGAQLIL
ncbi:KUP/HAK/KT family potassium transporter [Luteolibacter yonseiensis]|uniref:Probable potassium transport system protein Kup n=1 Tax=Luteolibacter yonseiensis TaxID=1144680 RepID=A0A934VAL3_9BACT|nr:KUP/HAK/KT family potassium transporter [Luteolibacter yonseiensis]MBK1815270.1 KUP/HAK/KT family potassium transporter [Luteolibacter yonseiensis]